MKKKNLKVTTLLFLIFFMTFFMLIPLTFEPDLKSLLLIVVGILLILLLMLIFAIHDRSIYKQLLVELKRKLDDQTGLSINEFRIYSSNYTSFKGVYILYNETKNKAYVGQSKDVLSRINQHLRGRGNPDVYLDLNYDDTFIIKMIALSDSECSTLNELERITIEAYDSYHSGYNRTSGNY